MLIDRFKSLNDLHVRGTHLSNGGDTRSKVDVTRRQLDLLAILISEHISHARGQFKRDSLQATRSTSEFLV